MRILTALEQLEIMLKDAKRENDRLDPIWEEIERLDLRGYPQEVLEAREALSDFYDTLPANETLEELEQYTKTIIKGLTGLKIIKVSRFNKVLQKQVTAVYVQNDGVKEFVGESTEPSEVLQYVAIADKFIRENSK